MAVRIGHASQDEQGNAAGGAAGDQTGREVCTRDWYSKGWNLLLRPASPELAERSAAACEAACANPNIGYDQSRRNTLYAQAEAAGFDLSAIAVPCACDCSSLMHVCAMAGGANLTYGANGCTTRTMGAAFAASGDYLRLTGREFLESADKLLRGDILVKAGSHTVMVLGSGSAGAVSCPVSLPQLRLGAASDTVSAMQRLLGCPCGGVFDEKTDAALRDYQKNMNLLPDGICGINSWSALLGLTGVG